MIETPPDALPAPQSDAPVPPSPAPVSAPEAAFEAAPEARDAVANADDTPRDVGDAAAVGDTAPVTPPPYTNGWQRLPARARKVFLQAAMLVAMIPASIASAILIPAHRLGPWRWAALVAVWLIATGIAWWVARRRYVHTFWLLDADGFAVRRGRMWQRETRVPTSRVQHLDLERGPIERRQGLASLVLHTAGTRLSAIGISGIEDADAERLRDHFSRQIDRQDDDDAHG